MSVTVSLKDAQNAENFIVEFLADKVLDGDYSEGSALRDLVVKAISYTLSYLDKVNGQILARQSLQSINSIDVSDDTEAADDAVDEILSNWFATRNTGKFARVIAYGHSTDRVDITIPATAFFYKTGDLAFMVDNVGDDYQISSDELIPQFDSSGEIIDYVFKFPLVSTETGVDYNVEPGRFTDFDSFSAYVTYVETLEKAQGGDTIETTANFIARSQNLVTVRNLINARSCDAVLLDEFPDITALSVIGMGDSEMIRDRMRDDATGLEMHVGGHQDIFIAQNIGETFFTGVVGSRFERPDGRITVFRDPTYVPGGGTTFSSLGVTVGMVLRIWAGLPVSERDYRIVEVKDTELYVSEKMPFPIATDEQTPAGNVTWTIGVIGPNYDDVVSSQTTGETSKQIEISGSIILPGGPLYKIKDITIDSPSDPDADPADNLVHLNVRTNTTPTAQVAPDNEYQVLVHNPADHQSVRSYAEIIVGPTGFVDKYDGYTCKVTYDTLPGFSTVSDYVLNRRQRIAGANPLVRAFHPIYLSFALEYKLTKTATESIDETEAVNYLVSFINGFSPTEVLDVSILSSFLKTTYPTIAHVYPFVIDYEVHVPDGRVVQFSTTEDVKVPSNSTELSNLLVSPGDAIEGLDDPLEYGLTDDVMRYLAVSTDISITERTA